MSATESRPRLKVGQALGDGWRAFQRAPWLFVGFFLALTALQLLLQGIQAGLQVLLPPIDTGTLAAERDAEADASPSVLVAGPEAVARIRAGLE